MNLKRNLRLIFSLTSLLICFCLSSFSVFADDTIDLSDMMGDQVEETTTLSAEDMKTYAGGKITMAQAKEMIEQYAQAMAQYGQCSGDELEYLGEYFSYQTDAFKNFAKTVGDEKCGAYSSYDNINITEAEDGIIDISSVLHFEKRDLKMILHVSAFDTLGMVPTSVEFSLPDNGDASIGAKMAEAGVNTLMGMGTVFAVLIFISLIISCFSFIPKLTEAKEKRKASHTENISENQNDVVADSAVESIPVNDNSELVAVIAAAIAASENTSTDSFVVRSIRRR